MGPLKEMESLWREDLLDKLKLLFVSEGKVTDLKGNVVDADPVTRLELVHVAPDDVSNLDKLIIIHAPPDANAYMVSENSCGGISVSVAKRTHVDCVSYRNVTLWDIEHGIKKDETIRDGQGNYPIQSFSDVFALQYWRIKC